MGGVEVPQAPKGVGGGEEWEGGIPLPTGGGSGDEVCPSTENCSYFC